MDELKRRLVLSFGALLLIVTFGTWGYYVIGQGRWDVLDCCYMTLITVTTLGLETLQGFDRTPGAHAFTMLLLVLGIGTFLYFATSLTAYIFENDLRQILRTKRMKREIAQLTGHVIVCGVGSTGSHVVREMLDTDTPFVAIDADEDRIRTAMAEEGGRPFPYLIGDASDDDVLAQAGIGRARGLVSTLASDKDNLYVVVTARGTNPNLRIVARSVGLRAASKLRKAGADAIVSPNQIGGQRLASEVLRPHVVQFLDEMVRDRDKALRIEEVALPPGSPLVGSTLRDARIRQYANALVLAVRAKDKGAYLYNPGPDLVLESGTTLIVLGPASSMPQLRAGIEGGDGAR